MPGELDLNYSPHETGDLTHAHTDAIKGGGPNSYTHLNGHLYLSSVWLDVDLRRTP
jgi:hypothetical protein